MSKLTYTIWEYKEEREKKKKKKIYEEIKAEYFLKSLNYVSRKLNELQLHKWKESHNRYVIVKLLKVKDKEIILKTKGEKQPITYRRILLRLIVDILAEKRQEGSGINSKH